MADKKIIDYCIVCVLDFYGNIRAANVFDMIKEGWQPLGGLCASNTSAGNNSMYQVMVKYE